MVVLKTLHIAAAVLWLGNFAVTGIWSVRAFAAGRAELRAFAVREILFTDAIFTILFGSAVTASGLALASVERIPVLRTAWTADALVAIVASGIAWLAILLPLELRMRKLVLAGEDTRLSRLFVWWNVVGWGITIVLFGVIYLMVRKPA